MCECMCVYRHVCECMCVYVYICAYIGVYVSVCVYIGVYVCVKSVYKYVWMDRCERLVTYLVLLPLVVAARHARRTLFAMATARGRCSQARSSSRVLMPSSA